VGDKGIGTSRLKRHKSLHAAVGLGKKKHKGRIIVIPFTQKGGAKMPKEEEGSQEICSLRPWGGGSMGQTQKIVGQKRE